MSAAFDPDQERIVAAIRATPAVDLKTLPIVEARMRFEEAQLEWATELHPVTEVRELAIPGPDGPLPARLYLPEGEGPHPVVVYLHGGGWTFGNRRTHHGTMQSLCALSGCAVLGDDYRLAPEHPFPAPLHDVLASLDRIEAGDLGADVDGSRVGLAGDSAGATLALGAQLARRDAGHRVPRAAALFYGCFAPTFDTPSHRRLGDGSYLLSTVNMQWYWRNFLGGSLDHPPALAAPLLADLAGLPPLYLSAAGLDPLLDDTLLLAGRLAEAGVGCRLDVWPGVVHGFLRFARDLPLARTAIAAGAAELKRRLHR